MVLQVAEAQQLPFDEATFDTVVATLTLCSIPDDRLAVGEMDRVLRPGGSVIDVLARSKWGIVTRLLAPKTAAAG